MVKKFILNADGLGVSEAINKGVLDGYSGGILKSVSLDPCGTAYEEAIKNVLPACPDIKAGVHLNLTSGKSLCSDIDRLTDSNMNFYNTYFSLLYKVYNPKDKEIFSQMEREFRRQIETVMSVTEVTHIDSNLHIHSIPPIFELVCRLAKEYKIPYVRTHFEGMYFVPEIYRHLNRKYLFNFLKKLWLNFLSVINENTIYKYQLKTNDYLIGTSYGANMDSMAVAYGIKNIKNKNTTVEVCIRPCRYDDGTTDNHFDEYVLTKNKRLKNKIERSGFKITGYSNEEN